MTDLVLIRDLLGLGEMAPPEIIPPSELGFEKDSIRRKQKDKILTDKRKNLLKLVKPGIGLYKAGNNIALIDHNFNDELLYSVSYKFEDYNKLLGSGYALQFSVWKGPFTPSATQNIAKEVFFNYILPIKGCMLTDSQQTNLGARFWMNRITDAKSLNLNVYYVDFGRRIVNKITDDSQLNKLIADGKIWGVGPRYRAQRLAITNKELKETTAYDHAMEGI